MMKKMTSMLLALAMCLALSVPAFAAEEEPELTAEPAVQTEVETVAEEEVAAPAEVETEPAAEPAVETEATEEPAAQAEAAHTHVYYVSDYIGVDPNRYTKSGHAYINKGSLYECSCGDSYIVADAYYYQSHAFRVSEYGTTIGSNGETVTVYLYQCRACNYSYVEP